LPAHLRTLGINLRTVLKSHPRISAEEINKAECLLFAIKGGFSQNHNFIDEITKLTDKNFVEALPGQLREKELDEAPGLSSLMPQLMNHKQKALIILLDNSYPRVQITSTSIQQTFGQNIFQLHHETGISLAEDEQYKAFLHWLQNVKPSMQEQKVDSELSTPYRQKRHAKESSAQCPPSKKVRKSPQSSIASS